jgi:uncharacterized protein (TIGR02271 family)
MNEGGRDESTNKSTEPKKGKRIMKPKLAGRQVALAATVAAALTFASGCSSDKGGTGESYDYSSSTTTSTTTTSAPGETKAVIPLYKESVDIGKRQVDAGTVRVKKVVKTDIVNTPIELRHEEIVIERQPASASDNATADSAFQEGETVIHLTKEEPVIQKRTTSAGQVVLQTRSESMQTNIQSTLRSEDVDIAKSGDANMGGAESPSGNAAGQASSSTMNPTIYSSGDAAGFEGTAVQYSNRKVLSVLGDQLTCIDAGNGHPMYIYSKYGASRLKPGDYVSVTGVVKTSAADMKGATAQFLGSQSAYVYAKTIDRMNW